MNKQLQKLLESEVLNEETRQSLSEAITELKTAAVEEAKQEVEAEYAKKFVAEKEEINKQVNDIISETVQKEIKELAEDVEHYRNLEVEYAQKLEEFKEEYADSLNESLNTLIVETVEGEMGELKEDLMEAKKQEFGKRLFEAFASEFEEFGVGDDIKELQARLQDVQGKLTESNKAVAEMERQQKLEGLLESLKGSKREVMRTLLENVATAKLEDRYNQVIDTVLEEKVDNGNAKDVEKALEESDKGKEAESEIVISESSDPDLEDMLRLAGIRK